MKKLLYIITLIFITCYCNAQYVVPRGFPVKNYSYYNFAASANGGALLIDSFLMMRKGIDTLSKPLYPTIKFFQVNGVDSSFWQWDMVKWKPLGGSSGGSGGSVTSFGANNITNFATASVANSTTTPVLSYALTQAGSHTFFGNNTGSAAAPNYLQPSTLDLSDFPSQTGNGGKFLTTSGSALSWASATGGVSSAVLPITFSGGVISTSMATNKLIGRSTAGTGVMEEISLGSGLSLAGGTLSATATTPTFQQTLTQGSTMTTNNTVVGAATNFTWSGFTNYTTSSNNYTLIESVNRTTVSSLDSTYILAANDLELASVNIHSRATTSNVWGYTTSKLLTANSTGISITGDLYSLAATNKVALIDTTTGLISHGFVDQASQIRGITPVANGGTSLATLTANNVILGNGTSAVQFVAPGTSGNVLTSNGTTWTSGTSSNLWTVGPYSGVAASLNILQPISSVIGDTTAIGSGITTFRGQINLAGSVYAQTSLSVGGAIQSGYTTSSQGNLYAWSGRYDGTMAINTFGDPSASVALTISTTNAPTGISVLGTTGSAATTVNTVKIQSPINQTSAASGTNATGLYIAMGNNTDGSGTETSNFRRGVYALMETKSNAAAVPNVIGFESSFSSINSRTQTYTTAYGFKADGITSALATGLITAGGNYYGFYQDSMLNTNYDGSSAWGFVQRRNVANTIKNDLGGPTAIGGTTTNDAAAAGYVGEEFNSTISTYANYTTTATYQNVTSITLTAGDWDMTAFYTYSSNSATITAASNAIFVISTTTASAAGATEGLNISYVPQAALLGTSKFSDAISPYRVSLSATTTYYLNTQATFTLGNPQYVGSIRARRIR